MRHRLGSNLSAHAVLTPLAAIALLPVLATVVVALQPGGALGTTVSLTHGFTLDNFRRAWETGSFGSSLVTSAIVAAFTTMIVTALATLAGFAFGLMRFRGSTVLFYALLIGLIFPLEGFVVPLYYQLQSWSLLDSYLGLILCESAFVISFGTFWMGACFRAMPRSLLEAGRIDGASNMHILRSICLPVARPAMLTLMILTFMWTWNDFLLPLIALPGQNLQTATVGLAFFVGQRTTDISGLAAGALIVSGPVIVLYLLMQRHFVRGMLSGALKG